MHAKLSQIFIRHQCFAAKVYTFAFNIYESHYETLHINFYFRFEIWLT